jgi:hypothetical protein
LIITFFFSFFYFSHFLFLSWRFNVGVKSPWTSSFHSFVKTSSFPPFSRLILFFFPLSAAGLCCWADERVEAFEFGYLIVLAFGSYACVCAMRTARV